MLVSRRTALILVGVGFLFYYLGNLGSKKGNPLWLGAPICLLLLIALGITALVRRMRAR
jgi:hypothetical protein